MAERGMCMKPNCGCQTFEALGEDATICGTCQCKVGYHQVVSEIRRVQWGQNSGFASAAVPPAPLIPTSSSHPHTSSGSSQVIVGMGSTLQGSTLDRASAAVAQHLQPYPRPVLDMKNGYVGNMRLSPSHGNFRINKGRPRGLFRAQAGPRQKGRPLSPFTCEIHMLNSDTSPWEDFSNNTYLHAKY